MLIKLVFFLISALISTQAFAGAIVSYHGRILKPDGLPLEGANVAFKIQVRSPGAPNCLLYEETRSLNMNASNGIFVIPIGDGNGARTGSDPGITVENVFSNNTALNFTSLTCNSGNSYNPSLLDSRRLVVSFDDSSGAGVQTLASMDINYVPLALHAYEAQSALKVGSTPAANVMTVSGPASALTPSNFTELLALVNGTSTTYAKTSSSVGGDLSGTIASANVVKLQGRAVSSSAPSTNDVLTWNGSAWAPAAGGGGGAVSSVAGRTGAVVLTNTDISGLGNASTKNVGTAAGTVAAGDDARFGTASVFTGSFTGDVTGTQSATVVSAVGGSTATNVHNAELLANSATSANTASTIVRRDASGDFISRDASLRSVILRDSGPKNITMVAPATLTNSYTLTWPLDKGALNQVLTTDASGNLSWSTPAGAGVSTVTSGGAPIVIGGSGSAPTVSVNAATDSTSGVVTLALDGGTTSGTVVQATDSRLTNARAPSGNAGGDLSSTYPNPTVSGIKGAAITYTSLTAGDVLKYNGSAWINTALSTANLSDSSDLLKVSNMPPNCAAGSSLTFSSPSGAWVCTTIPTGTTSTAGIVQLTASGVATAGRVVEATDSRLTDARAPNGNAGGDLSSTYPNPTVSKINGVGLSYTSLTTGDFLKYNGTNWVNAVLPAGASYWTAATGGINYGGGNVGIGTSAPNQNLTVSSAAVGGAISTTPAPLLVTAGALGTTSGNDINLGGFAASSGSNTSSLNIHLRRTAVGTNWNTTAIGLSYDVDTNHAAGGSLWFKGGNIGIGTVNPLSGLHVYNGDMTVGNGLAGAVGDGGRIVFRTDFGSNDTVGAASIKSLNTWGSEANGQSGHLAFSTNYRTGANTYTGLLERMRITDAGNVGIGTTNPTAKLQVAGQVVSGVFDAGSGTSIDWSNGNGQYTSANCGAMTFTNMVDGGAYVLSVTGGTSGTCTFTHSGLTFAWTYQGPTTAGTKTVFSFQRLGTVVYVNWATGYQ